jgi:hypothetical protein
LQSVNLTNSDERVVYLDQQGQKIADSDSQLLSRPNATFNESFADLQAFKNAINGESGSTTEIVNGTTMLVSYHPVKAFSNVWVVLFMEPLRWASGSRVTTSILLVSNANKEKKGTSIESLKLSFCLPF